jgi:hypothetical protein
MSRYNWQSAETKISSGLSRVTGPAEVNEMVQYADCGRIKNAMSLEHTINVVPTSGKHQIT